jgi:hypothetical protein
VDPDASVAVAATPNVTDLRAPHIGLRINSNLPRSRPHLNHPCRSVPVLPAVDQCISEHPGRTEPYDALPLGTCRRRDLAGLIGLLAVIERGLCWMMPGRAWPAAYGIDRQQGRMM